MCLCPIQPTASDSVVYACRRPGISLVSTALSGEYSVVRRSQSYPDLDECVAAGQATRCRSFRCWATEPPGISSQHASDSPVFSRKGIVADSRG